MVCGANALADKPVYWFGVVPQLTKLSVHRDWTPLTEYLSHQTGVQIRLRLYDSIPEFETSFLKGEPDFAYMNPIHAVMAKKAQGYLPIVRDDAQDLTGILVVRADSAYQTVQDLENRTVSFPSPNAFAASLYMRMLLSEQEKVSFKTRYDVTHSNTYRQVLMGKADGGGAVLQTFDKQRPEVRENLRIIYQTPPTPAHPVATHPRVPENVRLGVRGTLLNLENTEFGREILVSIGIAHPVPADYDRDYAPIETLQLDRYIELPGY